MGRFFSKQDQVKNSVDQTSPTISPPNSPNLPLTCSPEAGNPRKVKNIGEAWATLYNQMQNLDKKPLDDDNLREFLRDIHITSPR